MRRRIIELASRLIKTRRRGASQTRPSKQPQPQTESGADGRPSVTADQPDKSAPAGQSRKTRSAPKPSPSRPRSAGQAKPSKKSQAATADELAESREFCGVELDARIVRAIQDLGFSDWTPVQSAPLPLALAGRDVAAQAQTGTGKTATFLITILTKFLRRQAGARQARETPFALILAPTRELAIQIDDDLKELSKYLPIRHVGVYGGMNYEAQARALQGGVDVVAATPGRLIDFSRKRVVDLSQVEILILDEADRMLDMGFLPDIRRIVNQLPAREKRQNMLFSATLSPEIMRLGKQWMNDFERVEIAPDALVAKEVDHYAYPVRRQDKLALLLWLLKHRAGERILVFRNRRSTSEDLAKSLLNYGVNCALLSGDVQQNKRLRVLEAFRKGTIRVVVATDVAGRGVHVDNISQVVNYDVPDEAEAYVHRIGRTGRAGVAGEAISFACEDGGFMIPEIEEYLGESIRMVQTSDDMLKLPHPVRRLHPHPGAEELTGSRPPVRSGRKGRRPGRPGRRPTR